MGSRPPRMDAPRELQEALQRQIRILDQVHDAVVSTDMNGVIQTWNRAAERIYGWSAAEAVGRHVKLLYFPEDIALLDEGVIDPLREKGAHEVVLRNRHASGREIFVDLRLSLLRSETGSSLGVIGCSHDVTERMRAAEALDAARREAEASLSLLTTLFRSAPVGLAFLDCDLRYVRINDALAEINGVPVSAHLGRRLSEVVPKLAPTLEPIYRRVIETRTPVVDREVSGETAARPGELRHWRANYYPVDAPDGRVLGVGVVIAEITAHKRDQEAIRKERIFSEGLIQLAQSIVLVLDQEGRILRFNPFMERLSGYRLEEVQGRDWFRTFLPKRDWERIRHVFAKALQRVESHGNINAILTKDGEERQIAWWDTTLTDADGNVQGVLAIGQDITDYLAAQEQVMRSQRLAAIGETITMIAHESRSELDSLGLALQVLADDTTHPVQAEQARWIALMRESHGRLQHLFQDLREFAAPLKLDLGECDLSDAWRAAWAGLLPQRQGRSAVLKEELGGEKAPVTVADPLRIEQVFRNLFENALEACSDPAEIEVRCSEVEQQGKKFVQVVVRDNGPGLTREEREKLFEPFFTGQRRSRGIGLGLAIVRRIIECHGGSVAVGDGPGGATLLIRLPEGDGRERRAPEGPHATSR